MARTLTRAPRRTAVSPAATPPPPRIAASQRATTTVLAETCTDCSAQGGPAAGRTIGGAIQLDRSSDAPIMIKIELAIPAAAVQVRTRMARLGRDTAMSAAGSAGMRRASVPILLLIGPS